MKGITGKVAVIAGGATTFGAAVVDAFVEAGAKVALADIDAAAGRRLADRHGESVLFRPTDIADDGQIAAFVEAAVGRFGGIDFVVSMACSYLDRGMASSRAEWHKALDVNLIGGALLVQMAEPHLRARGGGAVVNFASIGGKAGRLGRWIYPTSKAAIIELTRCQAMDLAAGNIRVNSLSPAWTWSGPLAQAAGGDRERARAVAAPLHMLKRFAEPGEVAQAVLFLCSDHASFITGSDLACDGGNSAMGPEGDRTPLAELRAAARAPNTRSSA
jgi:NAD(P)-dependent dehydrogenase (short-subunit alcohol dehydrogenase family)